ncbi:4109_t:CDS:1, partial [Dentiscutata erythropus]
MFFKSEEELLVALTKRIYYYNAKLDWVSPDNIKENFKNRIVNNRGGATTCSTNQEESNIVERKKNLYIPTKSNENKTSGNSVPHRRP